MLLQFRRNNNPLTQTVITHPSKLFLDIRTDPEDRKFLYFPFMSISDIHWAAGESRAKRVCMALGGIRCSRLDGVGDLIDGLKMEKKETFHLGPWHRQGIATVLRKAGGEKTEVNVYPGNHDTNMRPKIGTGKIIYDVNFLRDGEYTDPKGRKFKIEHGDRYDKQAFGKNQTALYKLGDAVLEMGYLIDRAGQYCISEKFSIAAWGKRRVKNFINKNLGVLHTIESDIDQSQYDGLIYGHTHMKGFHQTPKRKLLINDGSCTEHVQFAVHDIHGNWGVIEYHRDRMDIEMEDGHEYSVYWKDLGLDHFGDDPKLIEDQYTQRADRLLRLAYRLWPPKEHKKLKEEITIKENVVAACTSLEEQGVRIPLILGEAYTEALRTLDGLYNKLHKNPVPHSGRNEKAQPSEEPEFFQETEREFPEAILA